MAATPDPSGGSLDTEPSACVERDPELGTSEDGAHLTSISKTDAQSTDSDLNRSLEDADDDLMIMTAEQDIPLDIRKKWQDHQFTCPDDDVKFVEARPVIKEEEPAQGSGLADVPIKEEEVDDYVFVGHDATHESVEPITLEEFLQDQILPPAPVQNPPPVPSQNLHPAASHSAAQEEICREINKLLEKKEGLEKRQNQPGFSQKSRYKLHKLREKIQALEARISSDDSTGGEDDDDENDRETPDDKDHLGDGNHQAPQFAAAEDAKREAEASKKSRNPRAKTAKEYWEREYTKVADEANRQRGKRPLPAIADDDGRKPKRRKTASKKKKAGQNQRGAQLLKMLKHGDPIMARATLGEIVPEPGAMRAITKAEQWEQIVASLGNNPNRQAKVDKTILNKASKSFGYNKCKAEDGKWRLDGMKSGLYNHQLVGVRWMLGQEFSPRGPFGGILADEMGLGKTIEVLACMASNPPLQQDRENGCYKTLIVAPSAVAPQWKDEINEHLQDGSSFRYRASAAGDYDALVRQANDVVITSYQELSNAYPSDADMRQFQMVKLQEERDGVEEGESEWAKEFDKRLGDLFKVRWYRVVLDEAHAIKNYKSRTSQACIELNGKYRWALSGTPIHNSVLDLYPYAKFIGAEWAASFTKFGANFGDLEDDTVQERLLAIMGSIMLRRRVDDTFLGKPILEIPTTHKTVLIWVDLSKEERLIYRRLESRFRDNLSQHIKEGTTSKKMNNYFSYITRLRQATAHPFLLEATMKSDFTAEDISWLRESLAKIGGQTPPSEQTNHWHKTRLSKLKGVLQLNRFMFGAKFSMDPQLKKMEGEKTLSELLCRACYEEPEDLQITKCGHTFCKGCIESLSKEDTYGAGGGFDCPACGNTFRDQKGWRPLREPGERRKKSTVHSQDSDAALRSRKTTRAVGDDVNLVQPGKRSPSTFLDESDKTPEAPVTPSAKTAVIKNVVIKWQADAPNDKIIIFTQWITMGRIIGRMLQAENIDFLYFFGDMTLAKRNRAIADFHENADIKVLIASTKCGGQGLNLTAANRVILVDLWWNTAVENQAFGRIHRIGQKKETHFIKIMTKNTIDQRLVQMQKTKDETIKAVLSDGEGVTMKSLSLLEIQRLFGGFDEETLEPAEEGT